MTDHTVSLLVQIPYQLRVRLRVAAAQAESTITDFVIRALEEALQQPARSGRAR